MFLEKGVKSKEGRRQAVQEKTNLVMLLGDNLVDFAEFSKTSETERNQKLEELQKEFGEKFIIFPNPMYGSWESTVYNGNKLDAKGQTEERQKTYKVLINKIRELSTSLHQPQDIVFVRISKRRFPSGNRLFYYFILYLV